MNGRHKKRKRKSRANPRPDFVDLPSEIWKPIPNAPGYEVSNLGRARTWKAGRHGLANKPKLLRQWSKSRGYMAVTVCINGQQRTTGTHRLVIEAFVGPIPEGMYVCHKNDVSNDNRLENLYVGTPKQNSADRVKNGIQKYGEDVHNSKLKEDDVHRIRSLRGVRSQRTIAADFGISQSTVMEIQTYKIWRHI